MNTQKVENCFDNNKEIVGEINSKKASSTK